MEKYFCNEFCPKCKHNTLTINKGPFHHIESCEKEDCNYKYEEYKENYEEYLYNKFSQV